MSLRACVHVWVREINATELRYAAGASGDGVPRVPIHNVAIAGSLAALLARGGVLELDARRRGGDAERQRLWEQADALVSGTEFEQLVVAPLRIGQQATGVLCVSRPAQATELSREQVLLVGELAASIALAVDHARLVSGAMRTVRQQQALATLSGLALKCPDVDELLGTTVEELRAGLGTDVATLYLLNEDRRSATVLASAGASATECVGERITLRKELFESRWPGAAQLRELHAGDPRYPGSMAEAAGIASVLNVTLAALGGSPSWIGTGSFVRRPFPLGDRRFVVAVAQLVSAGVELRARQDRLERQAQTDPLTGVWSRRRLAEALAQIASDTTDASAALLVADLDDFKTINDALGHRQGDRVLRTVALRLAAAVRPTDVVARVGGDEFAIVCRGVDEASAVAIAERIAAAVAAPVALEGRAVLPRISVGVALREPDRGGAADELLVQADLAVHRAKRDGGHQVVVYGDALHAQTQRKHAIEQGLRRAVQRGELEVRYQPVVDLRRRRMGSAEALVRWHDESLGPVTTTELIAVAETSNLVCQIDAWMLREAARQAAEWASASSERFHVSVNVSGRNFDDPEFVERVMQILGEVGCAPSLLLAEVTETHLLLDAGADAVRRLGELGLRVAIDDYGVGYSSVARLTRLPFRMLKIDGTFVAGMLTDPAEAAVVRSTIALGHELGKKVVAEQVEDVEQLRMLARLGCDGVQGYLLGEPVPSATMSSWLESRLHADLDALLPAG